MTGAKGMLQPSCRTGVTPARLARDAGRTNGLAWAPKYPKRMNDEGIFPLRGLYPSAAWLRLLMFVKHPEILRRKGPVEWKVLLLLLWLWLLRLIYFIKALYYLIRCFKDKGPRKFANTDEVRLGSHLDGGERIVSSTPQLGKREQRVRCLAGGSLSAPGDRMGKSTQGFQTYFCPSKRKICRLCLLPCPRPSPVAVNFWCVKLWSGRKKKNSTFTIRAFSLARGWRRARLYVLSVGQGKLVLCFHNLMALPLFLDMFIFFQLEII